jgi:hypothetical protein
MKTIALLTMAALAACGIPASAATVSLDYSPMVGAGSAFDIAVNVTGVFTGRDTSTDSLLNFGFNVDSSSPAISFTGWTVGSGLFDDVTAGSGLSVAGNASAAYPNGITNTDFAEPLTLAILHFVANAPGSATISLTSDPANSFFEGLQYFGLNDSMNFWEPISASAQIDSAPVPEPASLGLVGLAFGAFAFIRRRAIQ